MRFSEGIPASDYKKNITSIFASNTRQGFSDWRQCGMLCNDMCIFLAEAERTLTKEGRYKELFEITGRAYIKWCNTDMDDSNGETMDFCDVCVGIWERIYEKENPSVTHDDMLRWFYYQLENNKVWDYMADEVYRFMMDHFKEKSELLRKKEMIKTQMGRGGYSYPTLQDFYIRLMADLKEPIEDIRAFAAKSESYDMPEVLAKIETEYGYDDAAIALYEKRINERPDSYWSNEPRKALIEIYRKKGNRDKEISEYEKYLWANLNDKDIFSEYKAYFSKEEWPAEWDKILTRLTKEGKDAIPWYAQEGRFDLIMELAEKPRGSVFVETYEKELKERYPDRCLKVLIQGAEEQARAASKRSDYRYLARKLRKLDKYDGGQEAARKLALQFAEAYPRRRAMIEELEDFL